MKTRIFFLMAFLSILLSQPVTAQSWIQNNTHGFGDANNTGIYNMVVYSNNLYTVTENNTTGVEVWRYNGTTWTQVNTDGFGDVNNYDPWCMTVYNNSVLYLGTLNEITGAEVWRYDGVAWTQVNTDGFGDPHNTGASSMAIYNYNLYGGTWNLTTGGEVWQLQLPLPTPVPTMNQWGIIIFIILLGGTGSVYHLRKKRATV